MAHEGDPSFAAAVCPQCGASLPSVGEQIICRYCGARLILSGGTGQAAEGQQPTVVRGMRLRPIVCEDRQGIGCEAFRMLIPVGWEFAGGVHWLMNNPGMPAVVGFRVANPQGCEAFEVFPNLPFYWTNNPTVHMTFPVGSLYFGNEVREPMPVQRVLQEIVLPRYRGNVGRLQILSEEVLPDLVDQMRANSPAAPDAFTTAEGARVRFQYDAGGARLEEELYGVVEVSRTSMPMLFGAVEHIFWMADYLFSFRALQGQLDDLADLFLAVAHSFRLNPQWFGRYMQVSQFLIQNQIQQIQHVGQISRIVSQTSSEISDMMMDTYQQRQDTMDRISERFSQAIRGVDEYHDPYEGRGVELPGGYGHAWANPLGEYILTDDPNFNPNIGSDLDWQQMGQQE